MKALFEEAAPIFRAAKNVPTFVLGPTPRYLTGPCCGNPEHLSNMEEDDFVATQAAAVRDLGRYLRQMVWHRRWRNVIVVNPVDMMGMGGSFSTEEAAIRMEAMMDLWGEDDPVHPSGQAYDNMANGLLAQITAKLLAPCGGDTTATRGTPRPPVVHHGHPWHKTPRRGESWKATRLGRGQRDGGGAQGYLL